MCTEEGGFSGEQTSNLECPNLIRYRQTVATLDLYGGGAECS
jgi:hypothetical protein